MMCKMLAHVARQLQMGTSVNVIPTAGDPPADESQAAAAAEGRISQGGGTEDSVPLCTTPGTQGGAPGTQGGGTEDSVPLCTTPGTQDLPCCPVSSVLLIVTRWSQGQHQVLLYARSGQLILPSIEPEPGEPPLAAVVRLIKRYFVEPDAASRSVRLSQVWRGHALSATSFGYHLALPRPSIMAGYNPFRDSTH